MVEESTILLRDGGWVANNVYNWHVLRVSTSNCIDGRELSHTECRYESRNAFYSGVAISGISSIQLIAVADPFQADLWNVVESDKVVVARDAVD